MGETNKCRMCKKDIEVGAKKCPYCRSFQSRFLSPPAIAVMVGIGYVLFIGLIMYDVWDRGEEYSNHSDDLTITESELKFTGNEKCGPLVTIIGKIKNTSNINWENLNLEVICFNKDEKVIDVKQEQDYNLFVPKQGEIHFKISFPRTIVEEEYAEHKVSIINAEDADRY